MTRSFALSLASLSSLLACGAPLEPEAARASAAPLAGASSPASASPAAPTASTATLPAPPQVTEVQLPVPGFEPALLITPAREGPAPVIVVTHGAGGKAEPHCARYAELAKGRGWVLCTRGRPTDRLLPADQRGYFYDGHHELGREVLAALGALVETFGARVDPSGVVYAGYSQGAAMGILYLQQGGAPAAHVGRILLVEGGAGDWSIGLAAKLKTEGVSKVAIVCGQLKCSVASKKSVTWIRKGGLDARVSYEAGAGHTYGGPIAPLVEEAWTWLTEDDARWGP